MAIILISFTPLDASGGVPRFNRDFIAGFPEAKHYSWWDVINKYGDSNLPEWEKAKVLNRMLLQEKKILPNDIVIVDSFWGLGLEQHKNVVSIQHGNWSHTTFDDVKAGILPEFPYHHAVQLKYRKEHIKRNGRLVAVSEFISDQCKLQWNMDISVINNAIDVNKFKVSFLTFGFIFLFAILIGIFSTILINKNVYVFLLNYFFILPKIYFFIWIINFNSGTFVSSKTKKLLIAQLSP